jgi:dipeptidyl aminopeptidase/acylaminoacyl peptidase
MKKLLLIVLLAVLPSTLLAAPKRPLTEKDLFRLTWIGDPQLSPDGTEAAYVRVTVDEKADKYVTSIWTVPVTVKGPVRAGAAPRQLTNGPRDTQPRWSPDGKTLAFLRAPEKDGKPQPPQIYLLSLAGGEPHALTAMKQSPESIVWSPRGDAIAFTATTKADDLADDKEKKKDGEERVSDVRVINQAIYRENGSGYNDTSRTSHLWTIAVPAATDADLPKPKQLTNGAFDEVDLAWSPDASRVYFLGAHSAETYYERPSADLNVVPAAGGAVTKVLTFAGEIDTLVPSPDGKWIAFRGEEKTPVRSYDQPDIYVAALDGSSPPRNLTAAYDFDVLGGVSGDQHPPRGGSRARPSWSADGKSLFVSSLEKGASNLKRIDVATGRVDPWTTGNRDVVSYSVRGGRAVALVSTLTMVGDLFLVDEQGALTRLTDVNARLFDEVQLTEPDELWLDSFDGRKIETWVQRPPDFDPSKKYPLILNIHGGPHAAYGYTFDHEFQWMAAKGYVVVYPNPRGSSSYGQEFGNVIQYRYPGDDYKDLMAAVDAVIAKGSIDPKKLGVTGGSGGGLLTNWVITQTDRFAAAVSQRDIADWSTFWYVADFQQFQPSWFRKPPFENPAEYAERSPITYIERVHTPLMLILGEADWRTPPMAGGEMMFRALKYLHRPAVMVRFPDESHELSRSGKPWHRVERLQHIVGWFDKWLLGKGGEQYDAGLRQ